MEITRRQYTFSLVTPHRSGVFRTGKNPFTGEAVELERPGHLTPEELHGLLAALGRHGYSNEGWQEGEYGRREGRGAYQLLRGLHLVEDKATGSLAGELVVHELREEHVDALFDIVRSGNLVLTNGWAEKARCVGREPSDDERDRWPDVRRIDSTADLRVWLEDELGHWPLLASDD